MRSRRAVPPALLLLLALPLFFPASAGAQSSDRIWGRITTDEGEVLEGFIRWDRNEGAWVDLLDGSKYAAEFESLDWWALAHPDESRSRDRVIEYGGYRITWADDVPDFPSSFESGIRMGHISRLVVEDNEARLELRSGEEVVLHGGLTDIGRDLREILVVDARGRETELEWGDLADLEFSEAPLGVTGAGERLHGTVHLADGQGFTGYIAWDLTDILTTDPLEGEDSEGRQREYLYEDIASIRPSGDGAEIVLKNGNRFELYREEDVSDRNDGIHVSDPALGLIDLDWEDLESVEFHRPETPVGLDAFDGGRHLRGTVTTTDSTEISGWIRWDGDEAYSWELLDGRSSDGVGFDIELGQIDTIERFARAAVEVSMGTGGVRVDTPLTEGARVTLRDGREFELGESNDVDESNHGVFLLPYELGVTPEDEDAVWVRVRWEDFQSVRFDWEEGR